MSADTYASDIEARARDGIASHGSLCAYIRDFRASFRLFEMVTARMLSRKHGRAFYLWEDVALEVKDALGLPHPDVGIDITDTTTTIVQCKLRSNTLTWTDIGTFLACALGRVLTEDRALCAAWSEVVVARNACSRLSAHCAFFASRLGFDAPITLADYESTVSGILALAQQNVTEHVAATEVELRDYQLEAIELCVKATPSAAYVVLPTGCGKSLVMARVAAREDLRVLILVPLVALLEQMLDVLAANLNIAHVTAVGGPYEYDNTKVEAARVVVCVYNSAHKIDATTFDRVLVDEAHFARAPAIYTDLLDGDTAGEISNASETTAAEETEEPEESEEAEDPEEEGASASPTTSESRGRGYAAVRAAMTLVSARLFSATLDVPESADRCTRTLREMIDTGRLCDYRLNVPVFDVGATNTDLAWFLVRNYRSIIVYCSTRAEGVSFCAAMNAHGPCARYVDCDTPRGERREILEAFKSGHLAFVVNVRVLSVGFDAPITKGVCFVNMPASKTHIVQVIGRCLRVHPGKRCAQVILPLVAGQEGEDKRARDFMRVLAQTDARVAQALRNRGAPYVAVRRAARGDADGSEGYEEGGSEQHAVNLIYTAVYDAMGTALTDAWLTRYDELVAFYGANRKFPPAAMPGLGTWVSTQRYRRATMAPERKARLEALAWWVWTVLVDWDARFDELVAFYAEHGRIPPRSTPGRIGGWVQTQRTSRETMDTEHKARLDALEWWVWDPHDAAWDARFDELVAFHAEHGRLPPHSTPGGLGTWVAAQRMRRATMSAERKARLDALQWWVWDQYDAAWDARYDELVAYHAEHGRLPTGMTPGLGRWINDQRTSRETMDAERKARLDALPWWAWDPFYAAWSIKFDELVSFYAEHGRIPPRSTPGRIGVWVQTQRIHRATMDAKRKARLEALGWWMWDLHDEEWDARFDELVAYRAEHGRLPPRSTPGVIGSWVTTQRMRRATMAPARKARLDALGWWVWDPFDAAWDARYDELVAYHAEHGRIPPHSKRGAIETWVVRQRAERAKMAPERKARLDALEWWTWRAR